MARPEPQCPVPLEVKDRMAEVWFHRLRVAEVVDETPDARSLIFDVDAQQAHRFHYRPGQFLTLRVPSDLCGSVARAYSLASSPHADARPKVTVKRTDDGYASNWICDHAAPGTELDVLEPAGVFTPGSLDENLLLLAGGSGITPVMSIIKSLLAAGTGHAVLIYANRHERSVIFADELATLAAEHPGRLTVLHWLESLQGLPTVPALRALIRPYTDHEAFVCGPRPYLDAVRAALREENVPRARVRLERFVSLGGNPFDTAKPAPGSAGPEPGPAAEAASTPAARLARVEVQLAGEHHTFDWPADKRLLDLLQDNGLNAPTSCGEGVCAACECRVTDGEVTMLRNEVLEEDDLAEGYVLACQALPVTDVVKVDFP
jgi:3-ketosteroid 9alpha-monooxygenase subunit B